MYWVTAPWERVWLYVPTEEPWMYLVLPQALAAVILRPRRRLAWVTVILSVLLFWPHPGRVRPRVMGWFWEVALSISAAWREPALGRVVFWVVAVIICGTVVKSFTRTDWGAAIATAATGMIGSLGVSEGILWLQDAFPPHSKAVASLVEIVAFLVPAILLPILIWPSWPRVVLWTGAPLACILLTAILIVDEHRMTPGLAAIAALVLATGPAWAYVDWRRSRVQATGRGFEVLVTPT
jgi:hypothetical protein